MSREHESRAELDAETEAQTEAEAQADALLRALPSPPIDPAFSRQVLRVARAELKDENESAAWHRTGRFFARFAIPLVLVSCAAGYAVHYVKVAGRVYVSHDPGRDMRDASP
ncbi:MAG: hypothetical protein R3B70_30095 [Polyangiaceae bacterium]